jgi:hypothetical protein
MAAHEHDISLATAKSSSTIVEGMKITLATPSASLTPSTVTAMAGLAQGGAIQVSPSVTSAISAMLIKAAEYGNVSSPGNNLVLSASLTSAASAMQTQSSQLLPPGNPAAFGSMIRQAQGHISDATELKTATNFMAGITFEDMGSGITNMSSLAAHGLDGALGNLPSAAAAFEAAGPIYDLTKMSLFGTTAGLVDKLNSVKLGNTSGVNGAISAAGLDITNPEHAPAISKLVASIKDPTIIATVIEQLKISPGGNINNLNDLTNLSKLAPAGSSLAVLPTSNLPNLSAISSKFTDMGATFANPAAASSLLKNISVPDVPTLNSATPSLSGMVADLSPTLDNMTGSGNGPMGLPNITDFTQSATGGPQVDAINAALASGDEAAITAATANISTMVASSNGLISKAGINIITPPPQSLGSVMSFAAGLHKMGADTSGSGISSVLGSMATPDKFGDAIKSSLAEGKNKALLATHGVAPLSFGG